MIIDTIVALFALLITLIIMIVRNLTNNADTYGPSNKVVSKNEVSPEDIGAINMANATIALDSVVGSEQYTGSRESKKISFNEFCFPKKYNVQKQQAQVGAYMDPVKYPDTHRELLVFHRIGAGKTCASIQICERFIGAAKSLPEGKRPLMIMPASLIPGFRNELRTPCAGDKYLTAAERAKLAKLTPGSPEYLEIIEMSDERINKCYQIYSYNKFSTVWGEIDAPIIVVDEVQNVCNAKGVFYKSIFGWIEAHPAAKVVVMSATPIFDNVGEITSLAGLLRIEPPKDGPNVEWVAKSFKGKVSFSSGAPAYTYPKVEIKIVKCKMSQFQAKWYKSEVEAEMKRQGIALNEISNDFYIKSRQRSNIVFPQGLGGAQGMEAMRGGLWRDKLGAYSAKFAKLARKLRRGQLSFVYSNFTGPYGIGGICAMLDAMGWRDFHKNGPGPRRYAIWSGDETLKQKDLVRATFNSPANDGAGQLQIVIGSPSIKEGVSLMRVRQVHIMEAYWNHSRLEQIYGRANRYCSHKTLPSRERSVKIYIYAGIAGGKHSSADGLVSPLVSIDAYMLGIADMKLEKNADIVDALVECSI